MDTYYIPTNFTDAGRILGLFPIRNVVEAALLTVPLFFLLLVLLPFSLTIRLMASLSAAILVGGLALMGLNDDSLLQYFRTVLRFRKSRRILTYRGGQFESKLSNAVLCLSGTIPKQGKEQR